MSGTVSYTITTALGTSTISDLSVSYEDAPPGYLEITYEGPSTISIAGPGTDVFTEFVGGVAVGQLTVTDPGTIWYYDDSTQTSIYDLSTTPSPTVTGEFDAFPCFVAGTLIDTPHGARAVEDLVPGDTVTTRAGPAAVTWTGRRRATDARVVRFRAHALGTHMPRRDLCVSHDHAMLVDGVLVPGHLLVDGDAVTEERWRRVTFFHVELGCHAILSAEGAPAESYLDTGNRAQFGNCPLR